MSFWLIIGHLLEVLEVLESIATNSDVYRREIVKKVKK